MKDDTLRSNLDNGWTGNDELTIAAHAYSRRAALAAATAFSASLLLGRLAKAAGPEKPT